MAEYNEGVVSIDESDMEVAEGEPDVRGWTVVTTDQHRIGEVEDLLVDPIAMKVRYLTIELDRDAAGGSDQTVRVPVSRVRISNDEHQVIVEGSQDLRSDTFNSDTLSAGDSGTRDHAHQPDDVRLTRSAEELRIGKRRVDAGEVEVRKHVETRRVSEPVTRLREEVDIERRPVSAGATSAGDVPIGDDEIRVPLMEEEVVVEKRPVVKEEFVIRKRTVEEHDTVETDVREEKVDIENNSRKTRG